MAYEGRVRATTYRAHIFRCESLRRAIASSAAAMISPPDAPILASSDASIGSARRRRFSCGHALKGLPVRLRPSSILPARKATNPRVAVNVGRIPPLPRQHTPWPASYGPHRVHPTLAWLNARLFGSSAFAGLAIKPARANAMASSKCPHMDPRYEPNVAGAVEDG